MIGHQFLPLKLGASSTDPEYGYNPGKPVVIGGGFGEGSHRTYGYLNALLGPKGEPVHYSRVGTCCTFKTPNSPFGGEAPLEVFEVSHDGHSSVRLYFDWYDPENPLIPVGFTSRP
jgi:hypothetical protein